MTWVRLDDRYPRNAKVMGLSDKAFRFDVESMCYCAEQDTDGILPPAYLKGVPKRIRDELLESGRWTTTEDGIVVHDYLEYNPSANERDTRSSAARSAARMRWASESDAVGSTDGTRGRGRGKEQTSVAAFFDEFWNVYPLHVGKRAAAAAFGKALGRAPFDEILAGAERYRDLATRDPKFTAHPTTWLNQDRWADDPEPVRPVAHIPKATDWDAYRAEEDARVAAWRDNS